MRLLLLFFVFFPTLVYGQEWVETFKWRGQQRNFGLYSDWSCDGYLTCGDCTEQEFAVLLAHWDSFLDFWRQLFGDDRLDPNDAYRLFATPEFLKVYDGNGGLVRTLCVVADCPSWSDVHDESVYKVMSDYARRHNLKLPWVSCAPYITVSGAVSSNATRMDKRITAASVVDNDQTVVRTGTADIDGSTDVSGNNNVNPVINAGTLGVTFDSTNATSQDGSGGSVTYNNETNIEIVIDPGPADMTDPELSDESAAERTVRDFSSEGGTEPEFVYIKGTYPDYEINWEKLQDDIKDKLKNVIDVEKLETAFAAMNGTASPSGISYTVSNPFLPDFSIGFSWSAAELIGHPVVVWVRTFLSFGIAVSTVFMCLKLFT